MFIGTSFQNNDVDWLAYEYWSEYAGEDFRNIPNFRNASYDSWRDQLLHSTDYSEVMEAATEMQKIWVYECPAVICYQSEAIVAYRNDRFENQITDCFDGLRSFWNNLNIKRKPDQDGPFGGVFRWANSLDIDTFNFMASSSVYSWNILENLYDTLIRKGPDQSIVPWLAESYNIETHADNPLVSEGSTRITFNLFSNATWTDGAPLTGNDVAFSLNYYRESDSNPYGADLTDMTAAYSPNPTQVIVEFNSESYWHLHKVGNKPIIPQHVFTEIGFDGWATWSPTPPADSMVTSGPFNISDYVENEFVELTINFNYFRGIERPERTTSTTRWIGGGHPTNALPAFLFFSTIIVIIVFAGISIVKRT